MRVELLAITPNAEKLIESAARTAYLSFEMQGEGTEKQLIRRLVRAGHHSVLEHACATVRISGVSRACTHQLVRHRLCSYTQQSQRYVDESRFRYVVPGSIESIPESKAIFSTVARAAQGAYAEMLSLGIPREDARYLLPNATETEIVVTANLRQWRHMIELRGSAAAQWEIRSVVIEILRILKEHAPTVFEDFAINSEGDVVTRIVP